MDEGWIEIGRELGRQSASLAKKKDRVALVRQRAKESGRSPHTVGRFIVLAEFLEQFEIDPADEARLPVGVIEVIHRVDAKDRRLARSMMAELIEKGMTYREALKKMDVLTESLKNAGAGDDGPSEYMYVRISSCLGHHTPEDLDYIRPSSYDSSLSSVSSSWKLDKINIAFISEADAMYTFKRGFKNFARNVFLAKDEYDFVIVECLDQSSYDRLCMYEEKAIEMRRNAILLYGFVKHGEISK